MVDLDLVKELSEDIRSIMQNERNKASFEAFNKLIYGRKFVSCLSKIGWRSGEYISITMRYDKGAGTKEPFDQFIESIEDKDQIFGFINGLQPEIFHFDPSYVVNNDKHLILMFKLQKHE